MYTVKEVKQGQIQEYLRERGGRHGGCLSEKEKLEPGSNYKPGVQRCAKGNPDRGWCRVSEVGESSGSLRLRQEARGLDGGEMEPGTEAVWTSSAVGSGTQP